MYSSNNSSIYNYTNPGIPQMSPFSENDIIINSPSSLFNFPPNSPHMMYMEYEEDVYFQFPDIFNMPSSDEHHNHEINAETSRTQGFAAKELSAAADDDEQKMMSINVRKRLSSSGNKPTKKDRHSKINTARGPRDRRMRLSLDVARKFFDLQDLLGYDKASRTVEWLLNNSKAAIKELLSASAGISTTALSSTNCDDYCEVLSISSSTTTTVTTNNHRNLGNVLKDTKGLGPAKLKGRKKKMSKVNRRAKVERESRTKARERAKERTSQKRRLMRMSETMSITNHHHQQPNLSANNVRTMQPQDLSSNEPPLLLVYDGSWDPSAQFSTGISNQLHNQDLQEFQFCGKAWEDYNNVNQSG